ncbi:hypothetical protein RRG08_049009 [Elysia crispata]|uniref:Uncharacterized protein n=1 Tax=Elysia crispata TaxID=231223 RepID=A0AAE1CKE7_9GAST|nr:hypothetical protein RRG08_049009 [Elysia crispata]
MIALRSYIQPTLFAVWHDGRQQVDIKGENVMVPLELWCHHKLFILSPWVPSEKIGRQITLGVGGSGREGESCKAASVLFSGIFVMLSLAPMPKA